MLAHRLQLNSIAEGVETPEQLGFLKTIGCKQIQGFIFSKPLPEDEYLELYKKEAASHKTFQTQLKDITTNPTSLQMLIDTVFKEYPTVIISNLSKNSYYAMSYQGFTDHKYPQAGVLSELLDEVCSTLVKEDRKAFKEEYTIDKQLEAFKSGEAKFNYTARLSVKDGHKSI